MDLLRYLAEFAPRRVALAAVLGLVAGACSAGLLAVVEVTLRGGPTLRAAAAFVVLCALFLLSRISFRLLSIDVSLTAIHQLRLELVRRSLDVPLARLEQLGPGSLSAALTEDVVVLSNAVPGIPIVVTSVAILIGGLSYLFWLSLPLALLVLATAAVSALVFRLPMARARAGFRRARVEQDSLHEQLLGVTAGIKELKLSKQRQRDYLELGIGRAAEAFRTHMRGAQRTTAYATSYGQLSFFVCVAVVLFVAPKVATLEASAVALFVVTILYLQSPVEVIFEWLPLLARARVSHERLQALLDTLSSRRASAVSSPVGVEFGTSPPATPLTIELRDLTYRYADAENGREFVLGPLSLNLSGGEVVYVKGPNGSGKTTFAKVLVGLYECDSGEILLNGTPLPSNALQAYREHFSAVFVDSFLFNPLFGIRASDAQIEAGLARLGLGRQVAVSQSRLSTIKVSQGQKKRLLLLAALLEARPVCVFDEWAANQDPAFKAVFYRQIVPELRRQGRCVVLIGHDEAFYDAADRVVELRDGVLNAAAPDREVATGVRRPLELTAV